jgi:hypothetical protein
MTGTAGNHGDGAAANAEILEFSADSVLGPPRFWRAAVH